MWRSVPCDYGASGRLAKPGSSISPLRAWSNYLIAVFTSHLAIFPASEPFLRSSAAAMGDPVVQTIHRDPALLYVHNSPRSLFHQADNSTQLLDPLPHLNSNDPNRRPPPLRDNSPPNHPQKALPPRPPRTTPTPPRHQPAHKLLRHLRLLIHRPQKLYGSSIQEWRFLEGSG
jgi:hypothetical protein